MPGTGAYLKNEEPGIYVDINSAALRFIHRDAMEAAGYAAYIHQVEDVQ